MVFEGALPAPRMGLRRTAPALAPPLPEFLDKRATDTKALGNRALRFGPGFQRLDDPITKVLRVGFHTRDYTRNGPYKQLQPALVYVDFKTQKRMPKLSAAWFKEATRRNAVV